MSGKKVKPVKPFPSWFGALLGWATVFFALNLVPFMLAYLLMSNEEFVSFSLLYLGLISILAMVVGTGSWWQATRIEAHQEQDADVQDVVDKLDRDVVDKLDTP